MKIKVLSLVLMVIFMVVLFTGCIPGDGTHVASKPAGFFWGIWHGWLAPVSLVISIFNKGIQIYEPINTGWWYDFGFYMAIISGFGGLSLFRKKNKDNNDR